jgi:hypothetical protein
MEHLAWTLLAALASGFGGYFGAYLKKKGENLATHEDLDKVVKQMEATTKATESIKAEVSDAVWMRQTHWVIKKEVLVQATKCLAEAHDSLGDIASAARFVPGDNKELKDLRKTMEERWIKASAALDETILLVGITCDEQTITSFNIFKKIATGVLTAALTGDPTTDLWKVFQLGMASARNSIRRELGIPPLPTSQSNESSEVQGPDQ